MVILLYLRFLPFALCRTAQRQRRLPRSTYNVAHKKVATACGEKRQYCVQNASLSPYTATRLNYAFNSCGFSGSLSSRSCTDVLTACASCRLHVNVQQIRLLLFLFSKKGVKLLAGVQSGRENAFLMTLLRQLYLDVTTPVQGNT